MITADPLVDVTGLGKTYNGRIVIDHVSLLVAPGDIVGLVGANGGGKTTTLRMVAGLLRPDTGSGTVFGENVRSSKRDCRARIGYMSQRLALYPDLTVLENLRFRASVYGVPDPEVRIATLAEDYGIAKVLSQRFATLSGGWGRRVQFAATVIHAPPLLLLDEPTAGLDAATRQSIWGWLDKLAGEGHAIILATHDLVEAERLPNIMLYHQGRASAAMSPTRLTRQAGAKTLEEAIILFAKGEAA